MPAGFEPVKKKIRRNQMKRISSLIGLLLSMCIIMTGIVGCAPFSFAGKTLSSGRVGTEYTDSIATAGFNDIFYDLDYESDLPSGLVIWEDGTITGVPEEAGTFTFTAVAIDMEDEEYYADFTLTIESGSIEYSATALPAGKTGEPYLQDIGTATGMPEITYTLKEGSSLPAGLTVSESGELSGIPTEVTEGTNFTVIATASGCDPAEATFSIVIEQGEQVDEDLGYIVFEDFTLPDATVGEAYNQSVRMAYGVPGITYSFRFSAGNGLPEGMTYSNELGLISGTPANSTHGAITIRVTASAEGYESVTARVTLTVYDVYVATNRLEAEYIYLDDLSGAGYSSSPSGTSMIQGNSNASNGYWLGYLNKAIEFSFNFTSSQATSAKITLSLGSEIGNFTYTRDLFRIYVNGTEVDYGSIEMTQIGSTVSDYGFTRVTLSPSVQLNEGDNVITFEIMQTSVQPEGTTFWAFGCLFDYVEFSDYMGEIGWRPKVANLNGK